MLYYKNLYSSHILILVLVILKIDKSSVAAQNATKKPLLRVKNGISDVNNEYPYVVALGYAPRGKKKYSKFYKSCSGSLISPQWVLTAGHCVSDDKTTLIRYGNMTLKPSHESATYSKILKRIPHPAYFNYVLRVTNDIAMLLVESVPLHEYGRLLAADYRTLVGLPVKYVGLGLTALKNYYTSKFLKKQQTKHRKIGYAVMIPCSKMARAIPSLCLSPKCSRRLQAAIPGDSGGPVLHAGRIVGVMIRYHGSARNGNTNSAAPVSPFLDWISLVMSSNTN